MKRVLFILLCIFTLMGCRKDISVVSIEISSYRADFPSKGGTGEILFQVANFSGTVTAESSRDWLTILGVTNSEVSYVLGPNDSEEPRSADVTVTAGNVFQTVTVSQEGKVIEPEEDEGEDVRMPVEYLTHRSFGCDAGGCVSETVSLTDLAVEQWGEWSYENVGDWYEVTRNGNSFTFSVPENRTGEDRHGSIAIKGADGAELLTFAVMQTHFSYGDLAGHYVLQFGAGNYWVMDFVEEGEGFAAKAIGTTGGISKTEGYSLRLGYVASGDRAPKMTLNLPQMLGTVDGKRMMLYATDPEGYYSLTGNLGYELICSGDGDKMAFDFVAEKEAFWKGFPYGFSGLFLVKGTVGEDWMEPLEGQECLRLVEWGKGSHDGYIN